MNNKTITLALSLAFISSCSQTKNMDGPVLTFEEMDSDLNGYISKSEANANNHISSHFKIIDSDRDANINIDEFQKFMGKGRMTPPEEMETPEPGAAPY